MARAIPPAGRDLDIASMSAERLRAWLDAYYRLDHYVQRVARTVPNITAEIEARDALGYALNLRFSHALTGDHLETTMPVETINQKGQDYLVYTMREKLMTMHSAKVNRWLMQAGKP